MTQERKKRLKESMENHTPFATNESSWTLCLKHQTTSSLPYVLYLSSFSHHVMYSLSSVSLCRLSVSVSPCVCLSPMFYFSVLISATSIFVKTRTLYQKWTLTGLRTVCNFYWQETKGSKWQTHAWRHTYKGQNNRQQTPELPTTTLLSQWELLLWEIRVAFPKESQLQQSRATQP